MNRSNGVTVRPWWSATRRGNVVMLRILLVVIVVVGLAYARSQARKTTQEKVEAAGGFLVDANDKEFVAIRTEARATFPEFATAFKNRDQSKTGDDAQVFAVKSGFKQRGTDNQEFMWIQVTNIMDTSITGIVADEPISNIGYHAGDTVTVNPMKIDDWYYTDIQGGEHGGKSIAVLERRKRS